MVSGGREPICMSGPYGPFVLACGFLRAAARPELLVCAPTRSSPLRTVRYRLLLVESASLRLGERGPVIGEGGMALLAPGRRCVLRLARRTRLQHLLFDVVPSRRAWHGMDVVAEDDEPQPPPLAVWGVELPELVPTAVLPRLRERWSRIRARYWRSLADRMEANALLAVTLAELVAAAGGGEDAAQPRGRVESDPVRRAVAFGLEAARMPGTLRCRDLAQASGLSPSRFRRRFVEAEGLPPRAWLAARRLDEAAERLASGDEPVAAIGAHFGWSSPAAFTRAFVRRFGCTPSAWRRR